MKKDRRHPLLNAGKWSVLRKDGSTCVVEVTSHTLVYQEREAVLVMMSDVVKENDHLALSEIELRALFASMRDAVFVIDRGLVSIARSRPPILVC
ncbi:MAG: hypothetical protein IPJ46_03520 [Anaerolineales bacterium]|nr:hypothetical protein [Anaerolineales bacterium]